MPNTECGNQYGFLCSKHQNELLSSMCSHAQHLFLISSNHVVSLTKFIVCMWHTLIMKANEMHYFSNLSQIYLMKYSTCFRHVHCPSSGVSQHCIHAVGIVMLVLLASASMTNTYCMYTVLRCSWWWTVDMSETCRVLYQINMRNSASHRLSL